MSSKIKKVIFPVAGLGTRFLPATKAMPKEMLPVVDKPLVQYAVEEARAAGVEHFIFVISRGKSIIEDHFDYAFELENTLKGKGRVDILDNLKGCSPIAGSFAYTRQDEAKGLGHAVWCARKMIGNEPFAVILPDDLFLSKTPVLKQMVDVYEKNGGNLVAVENVPREHTCRYGILDIENDDGILAKAKGLVEKPSPENAPSTLSIIGRYILDASVFDELEKQQKGAGGEIQLTDAIAKTMSKVPFYGYRFEGKRFDCGDKVGFLMANVEFALQRSDLGPEFKKRLKKSLDF
ncbi:MAG: UTP--glucose-1-phosphate uridylyltransferase GalU [Alphaproteobacteria bacterium]